MANRSTHEWHCSPPSYQISSDTARKLTTDDGQLANGGDLGETQTLGTPINCLSDNSMESDGRQSTPIASVPTVLCNGSRQRMQLGTKLAVQT